jgi:hypothetical protein
MWKPTLSYGIPIIEPCLMIWFEPGGARAITWWAACLQLIVVHLISPYPKEFGPFWPTAINEATKPSPYLHTSPCSHTSVFLGQFCVIAKSGNDPQEDLIARFVYKLHIKVEHPSVF